MRKKKKGLTLFLAAVLLMGIASASYAVDRFSIESLTISLLATEVAPGREFPRDFLKVRAVIKNNGRDTSLYMFKATPVNASGSPTDSGWTTPIMDNLAAGARKIVESTVWVYHDPEKTYTVKAALGFFPYGGDLPDYSVFRTVSASDRSLHNIPDFRIPLGDFERIFTRPLRLPLPRR